MNQLLQSSSNPEKLSMTVQGMLMGIVPVFLAIFKLLDVPLTEGDLVALIQVITAIIAGVTMLVGMLRKFANAIKDTFTK